MSELDINLDDVELEAAPDRPLLSEGKYRFVIRDHKVRDYNRTDKDTGEVTIGKLVSWQLKPVEAVEHEVPDNVLNGSQFVDFTHFLTPKATKIDSPLIGVVSFLRKYLGLTGVSLQEGLQLAHTQEIIASVKHEKDKKDPEKVRAVVKRLHGHGA